MDVAADTFPCEVCGLPLRVGEQGCIYTVRPHEPVGSYHPFTEYFDFALGEHVTSLAQRHRLMRTAHLDYRDKISTGEISARKDRAHEKRKEQARG
jgi:hypothetical protein